MMSDIVNFQIELYSPKLGTKNTYEFQLERKQMKIVRGNMYVICSWVDNREPVWSAPINFMDHPFLGIFENYSIYPPSIFERALVSAWKAWRSREINDKRIQAEITSLCKWINIVSERRPKTKFWKQRF